MGRRQPKLATTVVLTLLLGACASEASSSSVATTTTERSTTTERILPTSTTTTEPAGLGPIPDPDEAVAEISGSDVFDRDELLGRLTVVPEGSGDGYDRSLFPHWDDGDGDGCDTRAEVLLAESRTPVATGPRCALGPGDWLSTYDGYSTPDAGELEVDHVVALREAWVSGAAAWSPERRRAFANDLGHPGALAAVTAAMNRSKGDRDPAVWQPPNRASWCDYAVDWITVKVRWRLSADQAEHTALRNMLEGCGRPPTTTTTAPPPPPTTVAPVPLVPSTAPPASGGCHPSYPDVCIPPAPPDLDCGDIPHRRFRVLPPDPHGFDGNDDDGLGCES